MKKFQKYTGKEKKLPGEIIVRYCLKRDYWTGDMHDINYPFCPKCGSKMENNLSAKL